MLESKCCGGNTGGKYKRPSKKETKKRNRECSKRPKLQCSSFMMWNEDEELMEKSWRAESGKYWRAGAILL